MYRKCGMEWGCQRGVEGPLRLRAKGQLAF